jgi:UDP-3-O-[3-hydroxymyristoyl] glucosamine N-acyltransferase
VNPRGVAARARAEGYEDVADSINEALAIGDVDTANTLAQDYIENRKGRARAPKESQLTQADKALVTEQLDEEFGVQEALGNLVSAIADATGTKLNFVAGQPLHTALIDFARALSSAGFESFMAAQRHAKKLLGDLWAKVAPLFAKAWNYVKTVQPGMSVQVIGGEDMFTNRRGKPSKLKSAIDAAFGRGFSDALLGTNRFHIISSADLSAYLGSDAKFSNKPARYKTSGPAAAWITMADNGKWVDFGKLKTADDVNNAAANDFTRVSKSEPLLTDALPYVKGFLADPIHAGNAQVIVAKRQYGDDAEAIAADVLPKLQQMHRDATQANASLLAKYADSPMFMSAMLRATLLGQSRTTVGAPPALLPKAVAEVKRMWDAGELHSLKQMQTAHREIAGRIAESDTKSGVKPLHGGAWYELPSIDKAASEADKESVYARWAALSRKNWCTSQGTERTYAHEGVMWVYRKDGESLLAVRFVGDEVNEIQSPKNDRSIPPEYVDEVKNFAENANLSISAKRTIEKAEKASLIIKHVESQKVEGAEWSDDGYLELKDGTYALKGDYHGDLDDRRVSIVMGNVRLDEGAQANALTTVGGNARLDEGAQANALTTVGGDVYLYPGAQANALTTVGENARLDKGVQANALTTVDGDAYLYPGAQVNALTTVDGNAYLYPGAQANALTTVGGKASLDEGAQANALTTVDGSAYLGKGVQANALTTVGGNVRLDEGAQANALTTVDRGAYLGKGAQVNALTTVGDNVDMLEGAQANALTTVGGNARLDKGVQANALTTVGRYAYLYPGAQANALTTVGQYAEIHPGAQVNALTTVGGNAYLYPGAQANALTTVGRYAEIYPGAQANALTTVGGDATIHPGAQVQHYGTPAFREGIGKEAALASVNAGVPDVRYSADGKTIVGFVANGNTYLVADNIVASDTDVAGLLNHEIGVHALKLGANDAAFQKVLNELESMRTAGDARAQAARDRVPDSTPAHLILEEQAGYFAEMNPTLPWTRRFVAAFRALLRKFGGPDARWTKWANQLTADDIVYMARRTTEGAPKALKQAVDTRAKSGVKYSTRAPTDAASSVLEAINRAYTPEASGTAGTRIAAAIREGTPSVAKVKTWPRRLVDGLLQKLSTSEALQQRLDEAIRTEMPTGEANELLTQLSLSQNHHAHGVADIGMQYGGLERDADTGKIKAVKSIYNIKTLADIYKSASSKYGKSYMEIRHLASVALEARRNIGLYAKREQDLARANALDNIGKPKALKEAKKIRDYWESATFTLTEEESAKAETLFTIMPELKQVEEVKNGIREWVAKFLKSTGLWSDEYSGWMLDNAEWVPFYRELEEGDDRVSGYVARIRGLQVASREKKLRMADLPVNDVMDNFENWVYYAITRGVANDGARKLGTASLAHLPETEAVEVYKPVAGRQHRTISFFDDGKQRFVEFDSEAKALAFKGAEPFGASVLPIIGPLNDLIRGAILNFPLFPLLQITKDSMDAVTLAGLPSSAAWKIMPKALGEFVSTLKGTSEAHERLKAFAATGVKDYNAMMAREDADIHAGIKELSAFSKYKNHMQNLNMVADNSVRQAIYVLARESGLSEADAIEKAFNIINFRERVGSAQLAAVARNILFANAFLAATRTNLRVLAGRGISPRSRKEAYDTLASNIAWSAAVFTMYAMLNAGDEDYERMTPEERANKLTLPGSGGWGIPIRPSIATLPKTLAESIVHQLGAHADDPTRFRDAVFSLTASSVLTMPSPIPAPAQLVVEQVANHSFFTGRALIGSNLAEREAFMQYGSTTSELSKGIGLFSKHIADAVGVDSGGISPVRMDHLIRGLFGMYGGAILVATNAMAPGRPAESLNDTLASLPGFGTIGMKEFDSADRDNLYDFVGRVRKVVRTANALEAEGDVEEYQKFVEANKELLSMKKAASKISDNLNKIRASIKRVTASDMSAAEKADAIRRLKETEKRYISALRVTEMRMESGL